MKARGFALATVVLLLALIATSVFLVTRSAGTGNDRAVRSQDLAEARYAAEAGFAHARWVANNSNCAGYGLPPTAFGAHNYTATFTPTTDSPVTIAAKGVSSGGASAAVYGQSVRVFDASQTLVLQPNGSGGKDGYLKEDASMANHGLSSYLWVENSGGGGADDHSPLQFKLSGIPPGATVFSAELELYEDYAWPSGEVSVHRITRDWIEGTQNGGNGTGATWDESEPGMNWSTDGGDFDAIPVATEVVSNTGWHQWDIKSLTQSWVSGAFANQGLMLKGATSGTLASFRSSDHSPASTRPKLTITYACECGKSCSGVSVPLIVSTDSDAILGGLSFSDVDLAEYDPAFDSASLFFDGSATTLDQDITAAHVLANGHLVLGVKDGTTLGNVAFEAGDLIDYDPVADAAVLVFDGSELFLDPAEEITSVHVLDNGHLILSTESPATLGGLSFTDVDLVEYDRGSGTATLFFDGSLTTLNVDITALHVLDNGHLIVAARGNPDATLGGLTFQAGDLVDYDPIADTATLLFDGDALFTDPAEKVISLQFGPASGSLEYATVPFAHWKLDDGAGPTALDSVGSHDGTLVSNPVWVAGHLSGALDFDGVDDYVSAGTFDVAGNGLTMMGWFNAETIPTSDGRIVSKADGPNDFNAWWQLSTTDSGSNRYLRMRVKAGGTTTTFADSSVNLVPGQWYFAVGTYDATSDEMKLYLDGVQVASGSHAVGGAVDAGPTVPVAIGANGTAERFFDGVLDDVRVYDRALSAAEISDLYTVTLDGPIAHWKLDETSGPTAVDAVGVNDGTWVNDPSATPGQLDGGLHFDGVNDYVDAGTFDVVGDGITMMGWFNADTIPTSDGRIVSKADGPNDFNAWWQLSTTDSGSNRFIRMRVKAGGTTTTFADSTVNLLTGQWYFAVATYANGGAMKLYLDGTEVASGTHAVGGAVDTGPTVPVAIGANGTVERFFDGVLDDVRIYNRALGATEIADLYTDLGGGGGGGPSCAAAVIEDFETDDYSGGTGTWNGNWVELNENNNPNNGDEQVLTLPGGNFVARVQDNDGGGEGILRSADLSGYTSAMLTFDYWRGGLDNANDYVVVEAWPDGTSNWQEVMRIEGPANDSTSGPPQSASVDISSFIMNDTHLRFVTSPTMGGSDAVYLDNITICLN